MTPLSNYAKGVLYFSDFYWIFIVSTIEIYFKFHLSFDITSLFVKPKRFSFVNNEWWQSLAMTDHWIDTDVSLIISNCVSVLWRISPDSNQFMTTTYRTIEVDRYEDPWRGGYIQCSHCHG